MNNDVARTRKGRPRVLSDNLTDDGSEYTPAEIEFMKAMDQFKRDNQRPFPTWKEVLGVMLALGYRKST